MEAFVLVDDLAAAGKLAQLRSGWQLSGPPTTQQSLPQALRQRPEQKVTIAARCISQNGQWEFSVLN